MKSKKKIRLKKKAILSNRLLNEVGGAVKLKWKRLNMGLYVADEFTIMTLGIKKYKVFSKYESLGVHQKLSSAKRVAQLIYNG